MFNIDKIPTPQEQAQVRAQRIEEEERQRLQALNDRIERGEIDNLLEQVAKILGEGLVNLPVEKEPPHETLELLRHVMRKKGWLVECEAGFHTRPTRLVFREVPPSGRDL